MLFRSGYGDGYPRSLSNKGYVLIHGKEAPILGRDVYKRQLQECYDMVRNNRSELEIPEQSPQGLEAEYGNTSVEEEESFDLDEEI